MDHSLPRSGQLGASKFFDQAAFVLLVVLSAVFAFELTRPLVNSGPIALTNVETVAVLVIAFWLLAQLTQRKPIQVPRQLWLPSLVWLLLLTISTILAPSYHDRALLFMGRVLAGILIALSAYNLASTRTRQLVVIAALVSSAVIVAIFGLLESSNISSVVSWLNGFKVAPTRVGDILRVSSTLSYATITAMVLEMILPLVLVFALVTRRLFVRGLLGVALLAILGAHVLALSRAGAVSLLVALVVMAAAGILRGWRRVTAASLLTALLYLMLLVLVIVRNPNTLLRLTTETDQTWYRAQYEVPQEIVSRPGERITVPVKVTNEGGRSWTNDGAHFFALAYHLVDEGGDPVTYEGERTPLPQPVATGEEVKLQGQILAPLQPGIYSVEWDMIQDEVTWFSWKDDSPASSSLIVSGDPVQSSTPFKAVPPPTDITVINPTPGRFTLWQAALTMFVDYPLLGVGPDNFRWQYGSYAGVEEWNTGIHANNLYIESLADTGILGFIAFIWLSWQLIRLGLDKVKSQRDEVSWLLALGLVAGLITWYVHGLFDYFYEFSPTYILFWLMVGLLAAFSVPERVVDASRI
jgi:hypothetical protein